MAKLAGIPANVIKEAQNRLRILEKQQHKNVNLAVQDDLFAPATSSAEPEVIERVIEVEKPSACFRFITQYRCR